MSLIKKIETLLAEGNDHYFDSMHGLTDYHAARLVRNALRKRDAFERYKAIASALRNYCVMVHFDGATVRLFNPRTKDELIFDRK